VETKTEGQKYRERKVNKTNKIEASKERKERHKHLAIS
jgi:hypothetical protein